MNPVPPFDGAVLEELAEALRKRRKAIRHSGCILDVYKVYDESSGTVEELLEAQMVGFAEDQDFALRMLAWNDRYTKLEARAPASRGKKTRWRWTYEGRLLGNVPARAAVAALEETLSLAYSMTESRTPALTAAWKPLLARGPAEVR